MNFKKMNFKGNKKESNPFAAQDKRTFFEYISDNKKLVMPLVLVVAVVLTIVLALKANKSDVVAEPENAVTSVAEDGSYIVPEVELEKNAYDDVNSLMNTYFSAYASGDMDTIKSIYQGLESTEELRLSEVSKYITSIPTVDVYTKPGPVEGSYVAYVYTEVLFEGYTTALPGMQTMYVCTNEAGNLYINGDVVDDRVTDYISNISLQADVVDLNNSVAAQYNDIIAAHENLATFLSDMSANIQVSVGEALAAIESGEVPAAEGASEEGETQEGEAQEGESAEETTEETAEAQETDVAEAEATEETTEETAEESTPAVTKIKAKDVVNIRSSDSETADKLAKTEIGEVYTQLEARANGWSKIEYNGGTAFVKSEYFEEVAEDGDTAEAQETTEETTTEETQTETAENTENKSKVDSSATGKLRVSETVRLRKSQSTDSDVLYTIYAGDTVDVKQQYANGWAKVEYKGETGYIKAEYLTE
ncbi:SH3 domain-containing protein [Butyrivibrio sp. WCD3002]|uniref:SH3 domain-containing protein n=1 Tax=Butyrivibrio sp. WCD3002 TaxID=1280676 RepID=UPI00041E4AFF|nr:SH3 domain-containing protein [Butyrivibrio sp. WCD3002]